MYNGQTGEQIATEIFIGPVFYQRLKHMVSDNTVVQLDHELIYKTACRG